MEEKIKVAVDQAKDYVEEQTKELDAKADSLVDKAMGVMQKVKESNWTWFIVGVASALSVIAVLF